MSSVRIEQYAGAGRDERGDVQIPLLPLVAAAENVASGAASAQSALFNPMCRLIYVKATGGAVAVTVGTDPVAETSGAALAEDEGRWFAIDRTQAGKLRLAVIDLA